MSQSGPPLADPRSFAPRLRVGGPVRTRDGRDAGEVHRVVVDLEQRAVAGIVVLGRGLQARDVLVPIDFVDRVDDTTVSLRLTAAELDDLPTFAYTEFLTPPPTWTMTSVWPGEPALVPTRQRKRLGPAQRDVTPGTRVLASDGEIGAVDRVELEPDTGRLDALWVRAGRLFARDVRIPAEWIGPAENPDSLRVAATRAEIEAYLGHESGARLAR